MNILSVDNLRLVNPFGIKNNNQINVTAPRFGLVMPKPLACDTVTFTGIPTVKKMAQLDTGVPMRDAIVAHVKAVEIQPEITNYFIRLFDPIKATKKDPSNPVEDVRGRAKGVLSIWEKANTRCFDTLDKIFMQMTDLNGVKCVLRDGSNKGANMALKMLLSGIASGAIILEEVEVKRPAAAKELKKNEKAKYDYVDPAVMKKFVKEAQKIQGNQIKFDEEPDYTDSNYTAIHYLFRFPGQKRVFELQLMGHDIAVFKAMDDLFFKILNNKKVDDEFKPIRNLVQHLMKEGNEEYLEKFNKYRADSFIFQREKEPSTTLGKTSEYFLPLKYDIPYQKIVSPKEYQKLITDYDIVGNPYDFNNLYKIYKVCRAKNDAAREALNKKGCK